MTELEKDIERRLRKTVEARGGLCLKWVCPGWSGVPDRIVLMPGARIYFVETKRPKGGVVGKLQKWWTEKLRALGFPVYLLFTIDEVVAFNLILEKRGEVMS